MCSTHDHLDALIAIPQLIVIHHAICDCDVWQTWFADDATAAGLLSGLCSWWSGLVKLGLAYGYHVKPSKSWLIVKAEHLDLAKKIFADCGIGITAEGKHHLGATIGSQAFVEEYVSYKVIYWMSCVRKLSEIAKV